MIPGRATNHEGRCSECDESWMPDSVSIWGNPLIHFCAHCEAEIDPPEPEPEPLTRWERAKGWFAFLMAELEEPHNQH